MRAVAILAVLASLAGCKQNVSTPEADRPAPQARPVLPTAPGSSLSMPGGAPNQAAGVAWTIPPGWEVGPERQMRIATYRIHAIAGDPEDAECAVYFFGAGQGGSVEANLDRWAHQFTSPNSQSASPAKMETRVVGGLKVSTLAVSGTYLAAGGMMSQQQVSKPNFRMLGAIVQAPEGLVFFKLTGPLNTVAAAETDFNSLLGSLHRP